MSSRRLSQLIFVTVAGVAPLALWVAWPGPQLIVSDFYFAVTTVGKAAGIVGLGFFSGNLILSGRYRLLDRWFGGLDKLYSFHRKTGVATLILLSVHALVMILRTALLSRASFFSSLTDFSNLGLNAGRLAYTGLLVIVAWTLLFRRRLKYELVKRVHAALGAFLFVGGLHAYLIGSDLAENYPLRAYALGLAGLATASYLARTLLRRWLVPRVVCDVTGVRGIGGSVTEVVMRPRGRRVSFLPGQFIFVRFRQPGFPAEEHPFSLTASPAEGTLRISAKGIGDFTRALPQLKPGAVAEVQGPFGAFSFLRAVNPRQVWIAGGIGITPFLSMARTLLDRAANPAVAATTATLFYSAQAPTDLVFHDELVAISRQCPNFTLVPWVTAERGYLTADAIRQQLDPRDREIFLCGPKTMMRSLWRQLRAAGVRRGCIHLEEFRLL